MIQTETRGEANFNRNRATTEAFPGVPIIIGGSVFSRLVEKDHLQGFQRYFDYVCRYEGEQPLDRFLAVDNPKTGKVPNLVYWSHNEPVFEALCEPLGMNHLPTPDFDGLSLQDYITPRLVFPILATRGCYWGKCAFCYHGMIYQDRYRMRDPELIAGDIFTLNDKYHVDHFAFNDEAIPPKLFRRLPDVLPKGRFYFTGLYKFEKCFAREDYTRMYDIGFRSLYIGLETASERVQRHMRKNNSQRTMVENLQWAHEAGIWNHCFVFFGFPTETEQEAEETIEFMLTHADIIHSEGTGTFSFEHNAPIYADPQHYGVSKVIEKPDAILELYYHYEPVSGLNAEQAAQAVSRFAKRKEEEGKYQFARWVPREYLLLLLGRHTRDALLQGLASLEANPAHDPTVEEALYPYVIKSKSDQCFIVNRLSGQVYETNADAVTLIKLLRPSVHISQLIGAFPNLASITS